MSLVRAKDLRSFLSRLPDVKNGCLVDTNILFAANYSLDHFHDAAVEIFETLMDEGVPRFANVNVRSEFIHLTRKVVIAQALLDLFHSIGTDLPEQVYDKLKSIKTRSVGKEKEDSLFRLQDDEIEQIRTLFASYHPTPEQDLWDWFCEDHLKGKIAAEWDWVEEDFGINFLTLRYAQESINADKLYVRNGVCRISFSTSFEELIRQTKFVGNIRQSMQLDSRVYQQKNIRNWITESDVEALKAKGYKRKRFI